MDLSGLPAIAGDSMILRSTTHLYHVAKGITRQTEDGESEPQNADDASSLKEDSDGDLTAFGDKLKKLVEEGKLTEEEAFRQFESFGRKQSKSDK